MFNFKKNPINFKMLFSTDSTMASTSRRLVNLALIGRPGNGKSACGNSILVNAGFQIGDDGESCTLKNVVRNAKRKDLDIKVIDTPGVMDLDAYRNLENIYLHLPEVMNICREGIHAFCLVLKYGARDIDREIETVEKIKEVYGKKVLNDYGIIIMTNGDSFDQNYEGRGDIHFQSWCENQAGLLKKY